MRLSEQAWPVLVSKVRLGRDEYRVVRPARPVEGALLYRDGFGVQFDVGRRAATAFAMAWALAGRSPHSLVHLPLRTASPSEGVRPLDLVLLHHRLGFPISRWKEVRARLGAGARHSVTLPPRAFRRTLDLSRPYDACRDHLRWGVAADTLFLTGSHAAFEMEIDVVRALAEESPARIAASRKDHCCAEIGMGRHWLDRRSPAAELHVEYSR
ncbi:hypothetical protein [Herbidospora sp. RD11066]